MKKRNIALLAAAFLCLGVGSYTYADGFTDDETVGNDFSSLEETDNFIEFTDSAVDAGAVDQETQAAGPENAQQKEYEIGINSSSGKINLFWQIGGEDNLDFFGTITIKNIGRKAVTLHTESSKYTDGAFTFTIKPGDEYEYDFRPALLPPIGFYTDDSFHIYDETGNIDMTIPLTLSISGSAPLIAFDKDEINFGVCYEDNVNVDPQTITATDITTNKDEYRPVYPMLIWRTPGAKELFEIEGNPEDLQGDGSVTFIVRPKKNIPSGEYEAYLCLEEAVDMYYGYQVSAKVLLTVLPARPNSPVLSVGVTGNRVEFMWSHPDLAKGYQIYIYDNGTRTYKRYKTVLDKDILNYTKTLGYGKNAAFKIRAFNLRQDGTRIYGPFSSTISVKTATVVPVISSVSTKYSNVLVINWKKPAGAEGYQIYRSASKNGKYTRLKTVTNGNTLVYKNVNLKSGSTYYYKIRSFRRNTQGKRVYSAFGNAYGKKCI